MGTKNYIETRKLIKFGTNSHVVSIPKSWLEANKLKKGDELFVKQKASEISFMVKEVAKTRKTKIIDCNKINMSNIETKLISAYKASFDSVILEGKEISKYAKEIKNIIQRMPGFEIIEQTGTKIVAKDLIDIKQVTVHSMINRMDMLVRSMFQDLTGKEMVKQAILKERDKDLNRLNFLSTRILRLAIENPVIASQLKTSTIEAYHVEKINWVLERIGDYVKRVAGDLQRSKLKDKKIMIAYIKEVYQKYLLAMKAYYKKNYEEAVKLEKTIKEGLKQISKHVMISTETNELLAFENIKNILRDMRVITRATIEMN